MSYVKQEEAKEKLCCGPSDCGVKSDGKRLCAGSDCMAWQSVGFGGRCGFLPEPKPIGGSAGAMFHACCYCNRFSHYAHIGAAG